MYHFNLLPQPFQQRLRWWVICKQITNGLLLFNLFILIATGLLYSLHLGLQTINDAIIQGSPLKITDTSHGLLTQDIQNLDNQLSELKKIQQQHHDYLLDINELANLFPESVTLSDLIINYTSAEITIDGTASDRAALQQLQDAITGSKYKMTTLPLDIFTYANNIPFTMTLTMPE